MLSSLFGAQKVLQTIEDEAFGGAPHKIDFLLLEIFEQS
jgi:hypothetical protein